MPKSHRCLCAKALSARVLYPLAAINCAEVGGGGPHQGACLRSWRERLFRKSASCPGGRKRVGHPKHSFRPIRHSTHKPSAVLPLGIRHSRCITLAREMHMHYESSLQGWPGGPGRPIGPRPMGKPQKEFNDGTEDEDQGEGRRKQRRQEGQEQRRQEPSQAVIRTAARGACQRFRTD